MIGRRAGVEEEERRDQEFVDDSRPMGKTVEFNNRRGCVGV